MPNLEPLTPGIARQAETWLSGDAFRLPDGRGHEDWVEDDD